MKQSGSPEGCARRGLHTGDLPAYNTRLIYEGREKHGQRDSSI